MSSGSANAGTIRAQLILNADQFIRDMNRARSQMTQMQSRTQRVSADMDRLQKTGAVLGTVLAATMGISVKAAVDFEAQMKRVQAITGASDAEFKALEKTAQHLGKTTSFSASEAAQGFEYLAMAGYDVNQIISAMPGVLNLAKIGQMDLATAADISTNILSGFGLTAADTSKVIDVLAETITSSNTNIQQLGDAMKYAAPVASTLGWSIEETAAAIGIMSNAGIQGSQAGTSLRMTLLQLSSPSKRAADMMKELGINTKDANGEMKPAPELIKHISERLKGLTQSQKVTALAHMVGTEAASGFINVINAGPKALDEFTKQLQNSENAAQKMAKTIDDTARGAYNELKSALEGLGIQIGNELLPAFTELLKAGTSIVRWFGELDSGTVATTLKMGGAASAVLVLGSALVKLGIAIRGLYASMGPGGWILLGLSAIAAAYVGVSDATKRNAEVNLEAADSLREQTKTLEHAISRYDLLRFKANLTNDELSRFIDINSEINKTADPAVIEALQKEQAALAEKSGLTNEEMAELLEHNKTLVEVVPDATLRITEQGNALVESTDAAKKYAKELHGMTVAELELQQAKLEANIPKLLEKEKQLIEEAKSAREKIPEIEEKIAEKERSINKLREQQNGASEQGKRVLEETIQAEERRLKKLREEKIQLKDIIVEKQNAVDKTQEEQKKLEQVNQRLFEAKAEQLGINDAKGITVEKAEQEIKKINESIQKAEEKRKTDVRGAKEIDARISYLNTERAKYQELIGQASNLNRELGKSVRKNVSVNVNYSQIGNLRPGIGRNQILHKGGIFPEEKTPRYHTGVSSARPLFDIFSSMAGGVAQGLGEVNARLLGGEMVITRQQQAKLFNFIRGLQAAYPNTGVGAGAGLSEEKIAEIVRKVPVNVALNVDGREMARALAEPMDRELYILQQQKARF